MSRVPSSLCWCSRVSPSVLEFVRVFSSHLGFVEISLSWPFGFVYISLSWPLGFVEISLSWPLGFVEFSFLDRFRILFRRRTCFGRNLLSHAGVTQIAGRRSFDTSLYILKLSCVVMVPSTFCILLVDSASTTQLPWIMAFLPIIDLRIFSN